MLRVRARKLAAGAALTAALALVAFPGLAGSRTPSPSGSIEAAAFKSVLLSASVDRSSLTIGPIDPAFRSANLLEPDAVIVEPGEDATTPPVRPKAKVPRAQADVAIKPPRYAVSGYATWYDNGTTAMRLPYGTLVRICGPAGCVERRVTDYGPGGKGRVVDLMPSDFTRVCGCGLWRGTTWVTVAIY